MKKSNGFSLIEVITALMILSVISAVFTPAFYKVYAERFSIKEQHRAHEMIHEMIQEWLFDDLELLSQQKIVENGTIYEVFVTFKNGNEAHVCFQWIARNKRDYVHCEAGKR